MQREGSLKNERVLVIIPAFNEALNISRVVAGVKTTIGTADILVIDDGSQDDTAELARSAGARVVSHPFNMGYGVAIQTGYKYALMNNYEYVVQVDGDGQHEPDSILDVLHPVILGEADFALGSRFLGTKCYVPSFSRKIGMFVFRKIVSIIIRKRISDCTSGFLAFNRHVMLFFVKDIFPCDYPDADVLISLHRAGFKIKEVAVEMHENTQGRSMHSGLSPLYYTFKMLLSILVVLLRSRTFYRGEKNDS
ncbi:MAG: glycosyl transferase family 2 [Desulfuromonas sp.]|nr:MAG: glycosyl transferase family 2 [Desulfuromonas sp.]